MSTGWENHEPAPIEFLHGELMQLFHEFRKSKTDDIYVKINGSDLVDIIAKAKTATYEKYAKLKLDAPILKTDLK